MLILGLQTGIAVARRWSNLNEFIFLDKAGLKHEGTTWTMSNVLQGTVVASGGDDGTVNLWKTESSLFG